MQNRMVLIYMKWDYKTAALMHGNRTYVYKRSGDWLYMPHNVRVNSMLERTYWGEIDDHVHWLCENYNGHEFINGEAQISVCPTEEGILIMVFGVATNA